MWEEFYRSFNVKKGSRDKGKGRLKNLLIKLDDYVDGGGTTLQDIEDEIQRLKGKKNLLRKDVAKKYRESLNILEAEVIAEKRRLYQLSQRPPTPSAPTDLPPPILVPPNDPPPPPPSNVDSSPAVKPSSKTNRTSIFKPKRKKGAFDDSFNILKEIDQKESFEEVYKFIKTAPVDKPAIRLPIVLDKIISRFEDPTDAELFGTWAVTKMLIPTDGSTVPEVKCRYPKPCEFEVRRLLSRMMCDPQVVKRLMVKNVYIVAVPKNKYLTQMPMFAHLHDAMVRGGGRVWTDTRGVGGVDHNGKNYLACTEENLLGCDPENNLLKHYVANSSSCPPGHVLDHGSDMSYYDITRQGELGTYDDGYSTTTHEFAHIVHRIGLDESDKKLIEDAYNRYDRGMVQNDLANRFWRMPGTREQKDQHADLMKEIREYGNKKHNQNITDPESIKEKLMMGWEWVDGPVGITDAELERRKQDIASGRPMSPMRHISTGFSPRCYASSHHEEYFAQVSCCWLETNGGVDPYTHEVNLDGSKKTDGFDRWGNPIYVRPPRKNKKEWVLQNEPRPIVELLIRLYGEETYIPNTNPRSIGKDYYS